jgi:hypothetical protein
MKQEMRTEMSKEESEQKLTARRSRNQKQHRIGVSEYRRVGAGRSDIEYVTQMPA